MENTKIFHEVKDFTYTRPGKLFITSIIDDVDTLKQLLPKDDGENKLIKDAFDKNMNDFSNLINKYINKTNLLGNGFPYISNNKNYCNIRAYYLSNGTAVSLCIDEPHNYTCVIFLDDGGDNNNFNFYPGEKQENNACYSIPIKKGTFMLFPSWLFYGTNTITNKVQIIIFNMNIYP